MLQVLENLGLDEMDYDLDLLAEIVDQLGLGEEEAINMYDDNMLGSYDSVSEFVEEMVADTWEVPDSLAWYLDYDAIERDMMLDYDVVNYDGSVYIFHS